MKQTPVEDILPLDHDEAMERAEVELQRLLAVVDELNDHDWANQTDCSEWTVRDILGHLLGMWKLQADPAERARQIGAATDAAQGSGKLRIDELTGLQVREHSHMSTEELRDALRGAATRGLAARRNLPASVQAAPYDPELPGEGTWTVGYLFDVIHTRDPWLHRVDICRATGRELVLSPEHDGRIVENVVAEWAAKHRQPFVLDLRGPAGGQYVSGEGGEELRLDAIEFCRTLSGRTACTGLLATAVVF